jgi:hypothetical protein
MRKTLPADMRRNTVALVSHVDKIIGSIITTKVPPYGRPPAHPNQVLIRAHNFLVCLCRQIKEVLLLLHQGSAQDSRPPMSTFLIISTLLFLRYVPHPQPANPIQSTSSPIGHVAGGNLVVVVVVVGVPITKVTNNTHHATDSSVRLS